MIGPTKLWSLANERVEEGNRTGNSEQFEDKSIDDFIHVDRKIFKLLDEFESVTGKRLEVLVNKKGITLMVREEAA